MNTRNLYIIICAIVVIPWIITTTSALVIASSQLSYDGVTAIAGTLSGIAAIVSAGAATVGVYLLYSTLEETRLSLQQMRKTNAILWQEQRPWVYIRCELQRGQVGEDVIHSVRVVATNAGKTPALNVGLHFSWTNRYCVPSRLSEFSPLDAYADQCAFLIAGEETSPIYLWEHNMPNLSREAFTMRESFFYAKTVYRGSDKNYETSYSFAIRPDVFGADPETAVYEIVLRQSHDVVL